MTICIENYVLIIFFAISTYNWLICAGDRACSTCTCRCDERGLERVSLNDQR